MNFWQLKNEEIALNALTMTEKLKKVVSLSQYGDHDMGAGLLAIHRLVKINFLVKPVFRLNLEILRMNATHYQGLVNVKFFLLQEGVYCKRVFTLINIMSRTSVSAPTCF